MPVFVDSNVLVYAYDLDAGSKRDTARRLLEQLWESGEGRLSTQVLQEFYVNVTGKVAPPLTAANAREVVSSYAPWVHSQITPETIVRASEISEVWQLSCWDALILASAEKDGASEVFSEDLQHDQLVGSVRISNPFVSS